MHHTTNCYFMACAIYTLITISEATREDLIRGINRLNSDVIELRNEIEKAISGRCDSIRGCYKTNFDECQSNYTRQQTCPSFADIGYAVPECGTGNNCNGLFDYSITTVRIPQNLRTGKDGNPTNPEVIEAVCYTRSAQRWMVKKYNDDKDIWSKDLNVSSPQMFFGSSTGVFRIFPARQSKECGQYDPRLRPWYQASLPSTVSNTIKPRRVIIMMDTSRSMNTTMNKLTGQTKLAFMKKAVTSTVTSLSDRASISVIRFGEEAFPVGRSGSAPPYLWQSATQKHKEAIINDVKSTQVRGRSNWIQGFNLAFRLIKNSLQQIKAQNNTGSCDLENIALLFFSDGIYNLPGDATDDDIVKAVSSQVEEIESMGDYHIHPFFYSLGNNDVDQVSKQISCAVDGYWEPVIGSTASPTNVTAGYQALFATPLGTEAFYNYTSWSKPYEFSTTGETGYTISASVYNRDIKPPVFSGTVGMDIGIEAAVKLYGGTENETVTALNEIITDITDTQYNTTCAQQRINLTYCEIQSARQMNGGNQAICIPPNMTSTDEAIVLSENNDVVTNITATNETILVNITEDLGDEPTPNEIEEVIFDKLLNCSQGFLKQCPGKSAFVLFYRVCSSIQYEVSRFENLS